MVLTNYLLALCTFCGSVVMCNSKVVAEPEGITKYGLINNRPGQVIKHVLLKILLKNT